MCLAGLAKFGFVADLLSKPTQTGYMNGLALTIIVGQLPKLLGFSVAGDGLVAEARAFVSGLAQGEATVSELARPFAISAPAVTKHLKVLENAGLIIRGRDAQWRPCRIETAPLQEVADWMEPYRQIWEGRFDRLEAYLRDLQAKEQSDDTAHDQPGNRDDDH